MGSVYVVTFFKNPGWGSRIENYPRLKAVEVYESHALALKAAKDFVGEGEDTSVSRRNGETVVECRGTKAVIQACAIKVKPLASTVKNINQSLQDAGIDAEIVRGDGYFYFTGPSMDLVEEQGVYGVTRLSDLSVERWVAEAKAKTNGLK